MLLSVLEMPQSFKRFSDGLFSNGRTEKRWLELFTHLQAHIPTIMALFPARFGPLDHSRLLDRERKDISLTYSPHAITYLLLARKTYYSTAVRPREEEEARNCKSSNKATRDAAEEKRLKRNRKRGWI